MLDYPVAAFAAEIPHSFANTPTAFVSREPTVAELIADVIIANSRDGQATAWGDLQNAGFTAQQIGTHFATAKKIADAIVIRQDAIIEGEPVHPWAADPDYRELRVRRAAEAILGLGPDAVAIHATLSKSGYGAREIGDLWPEFMALAGEHLAKLAKAQ